MSIRPWRAKKAQRREPDEWSLCARSQSLSLPSFSLSICLSIYLYSSLSPLNSVFLSPEVPRDRIRECESERARQAWVANSFTPYSTAVERPTTTFSQCFDQLRADSTSVRQSARSYGTNRAGLAASRSLAEVAVSLAVFKSRLAAHGKRGSLLKNKQRLLDKLGSGATGLADERPRGLQAGDARGTYTRATPMVRSSGWKTLKWGGLTRTSVPEGPATVRALPAPLQTRRGEGRRSGSSKQRNDQRN